MFQGRSRLTTSSVTGVQTCALLIQAEDGIRDSSVTGVQTCALPIQAEDGIRDSSVTGVQTCALPICALYQRHRPGNLIRTAAQTRPVALFFRFFPSPEEGYVAPQRPPRRARRSAIDMR